MSFTSFPALEMELYGPSETAGSSECDPILLPNIEPEPSSATENESNERRDADTESSENHRDMSQEPTTEQAPVLENFAPPESEPMQEAFVQEPMVPSESQQTNAESEPTQEAQVENVVQEPMVPSESQQTNAESGNGAQNESERVEVENADTGTVAVESNDNENVNGTSKIICGLMFSLLV